MKRLVLSAIVGAGLLLGAGTTVASAASISYSVSASTSTVNGVTTQKCTIKYTVNGVPTPLTQAQINALLARGINPANCTINGVPPA